MSTADNIVAQSPPKEKPIIFNAEMIRAILENRKTQTRRVIKYDIPDGFFPIALPNGKWSFQRPGKKHLEIESTEAIQRPYGQVGDRLWVRETWQGLILANGERLPWSKTLEQYRKQENVIELGYRADGEGDWIIWSPAIHMPRWASRITLEVTGVRVERVQEISEADAIAEGVERTDKGYSTWRCYQYPERGDRTSATASFMSLWNSINERRGFGWDANPWVFVIEFSVVPMRAT